MILAVELLVAVAVGLVSGVLSGMLGIGGGIITTPAIRLLMDAPALVAVGTPLPVILPGAITGAIGFARRGLVDLRAALILGGSGAVAAVIGALLARIVGGPIVLLGTAAIIAWAAVDMALQVKRPPREESMADTEPLTRRRLIALVGVGLLTGVYSGFFGLGGGFVLLPMLTRWLRMPLKRATGTSLATVALLVVPGSIAHSLLGDVDWSIAAGLASGVVPGAVIGARLNALTSDRRLRMGFVALLLLAAFTLGASELGLVP